MTTPLVTALIPAYNAAATIRRAVNPILAQTCQNYEIIVIDDGSRDATAEIIASHYGDQVRLLRLTHNMGESGAMNEGIKIAKGELIASMQTMSWAPGETCQAGGRPGELSQRRSGDVRSSFCRWPGQGVARCGRDFFA